MNQRLFRRTKFLLPMRATGIRTIDWPNAYEMNEWMDAVSAQQREECIYRCVVVIRLNVDYWLLTYVADQTHSMALRSCVFGIRVILTIVMFVIDWTTRVASNFDHYFVCSETNRSVMMSNGIVIGHLVLKSSTRLWSNRTPLTFIAIPRYIQRRPYYERLVITILLSSKWFNRHFHRWSMICGHLETLVNPYHRYQTNKFSSVI